MGFNYNLWLAKVEETIKASGEVTEEWKTWADWEQLCKDGQFADKAAQKILDDRLKNLQNNINSF